MEKPTPEQLRRQIKELELSWHMPVVRPLGSPPLVFGYVHLVVATVERTAELRQELATFAEQQGLQLGGVFTDWGPTNSLSRPGFAGLMGALALPHAHGVVIPAWPYVSTSPEELAPLLEQLASTRRRVLVARSGEQWQPARSSAAPTSDGPKDQMGELTPDGRAAYARYLRRLR
jgi:hypothetical protein